MNRLRTTPPMQTTITTSAKSTTHQYCPAGAAGIPADTLWASKQSTSVHPEEYNTADGAPLVYDFVAQSATPEELRSLPYYPYMAIDSTDSALPEKSDTELRRYYGISLCGRHFHPIGADGHLCIPQETLRDILLELGDPSDTPRRLASRHSPFVSIYERDEQARTKKQVRIWTPPTTRDLEAYRSFRLLLGSDNTHEHTDRHTDSNSCRRYQDRLHTPRFGHKRSSGSLLEFVGLCRECRLSRAVAGCLGRATGLCRQICKAPQTATLGRKSQGRRLKA